LKLAVSVVSCQRRRVEIRNSEWLLFRPLRATDRPSISPPLCDLRDLCTMLSPFALFPPPGGRASVSGRRYVVSIENLDLQGRQIPGEIRAKAAFIDFRGEKSSRAIELAKIEPAEFSKLNTSQSNSSEAMRRSSRSCPSGVEW
jgi:hypothetical protein